MKFLNGDLKTRLIWCQRAQIAMAVALLLYAVGAFLLWIHPANTALEAAYGRLASAQAELREDQNRVKHLPLVEQQIARLRQRVERFDKKLPHQQNLAQFINDLTRISQDAALNKLSWHLDSKPKHSDQITELPIQLSFEGDFQSGVVPFLQRTEDMQRLTRVRKLDLRATDAHDGHVKAEMTMNIYFGEE